MTVIDASSLAKYLLREDNWRTIREHLEADVCSLNLALAEVSNAIWKHHVLYGRISEEEARAAFEAVNLLKDVVVFASCEDYLDKAMDIAREHTIPVYDALYLSQAEEHGTMMTSDAAQRDVAHNMNISVAYIE